MGNGIITAAFASKATGGEIFYDGGVSAAGVSVDSRNVTEGIIFAAVKGEKTDGHLYIMKAAEAGAHGIICENTPDYNEISKYPCFVIKVKDTIAALGNLAKAYKEQMSAVTVGITGSVGKTTTRTLIQSVVSEGFVTHGTSGNFNNEIGLPISVLGLEKNHEAAVFELGMGKKGDISYLSDICKPDIGVITNIGTAHIEYLGSRENIRDAKLEIRDGMKKDGLLILNGDEPLLAGIDGAVYCGIENKNSDVYAEKLRYTDGGMIFDIKSKCNGRCNSLCSAKADDVFVPAYGEHIVLDCLYAWTVGTVLGISEERKRRGLASYEGVGMRQRIVSKNGVTYILDYYNASAESIFASEKVARALADKNGGRFIAVIGSVLELGDKSDEIHRKIGEYTSGIADIYIAFGAETECASKEAALQGMTDVNYFGDIEDISGITECIKNKIKNGDVVLFKASHGIRLGRVADAVTENNPGDKV